MNGNPLFGQMSPNSTYLELWERFCAKKNWRANHEIWRGKCNGVRCGDVFPVMELVILQRWKEE